MPAQSQEDNRFWGGAVAASTRCFCGGSCCHNPIGWAVAATTDVVVVAAVATSLLGGRWLPPPDVVVEAAVASTL